MLDTSPTAAGADAAPLIGGITLFVAGVLAYVGRLLGTKAKEEHPFAPIPEAAGVALGLTDRQTQLEIAKDTERTADAAVRAAVASEGIRDMLKAYIADAEEDREERDRREAAEKLDEVRRERDRLQALLDDARRSAGPYTVQPRKD